MSYAAQVGQVTTPALGTGHCGACGQFSLHSGHAGACGHLATAVDIAREIVLLRSGVVHAGQTGQVLEGHEGQLDAAAAAMAWTFGQPLKRGKITAVKSTPVMKEKSIDIRQRCNVRWR